MSKKHKITYLLGAGASFESVPIWKEQGLTMRELGNRLKSKSESLSSLKAIFENMHQYGIKAMEFGTIDIYARKLFLNNRLEELNDLKLALSLYLDIWENFEEIRESIKNELIKSKNIDENRNYDAVDKRYYSLLSVILKKSNQLGVQLDENVNFITWNYDLQLESAYESFLMEKTKSLRELDQNIKFLNDGDLSKNRIIHLNGMRGCFETNGKFQDIIDREFLKKDFNKYLYELDKIYNTRNSKDNMQNSINYSWEGKDDRINVALELLKKTDILVIIGYSFPSFNKLIDAQLINAFNEKGKLLFYQDLNPKLETFNFTKLNKSKFKESKNCNQFHIPNEFFPDLRTGNNSENLTFVNM